MVERRLLVSLLLAELCSGESGYGYFFLPSHYLWVDSLFNSPNFIWHTLYSQVHFLGTCHFKSFLSREGYSFPCESLSSITTAFDELPGIRHPYLPSRTLVKCV